MSKYSNLVISIFLLLLISIFSIQGCNESSSKTAKTDELKTNDTVSLPPVLNFTDCVSGPQNGNSDGSAGLNSADHGTIVTVWGNNLGSSKGSSKLYFKDSTQTIHEAAHIYYWQNASGAGNGGPSDLFTFHKMQEISFTIPGSVSHGKGKLYALVNGKTSNELEFNVRSGNIYFVKQSGSNTNGDGSWNNPWQTIDYVGKGAGGAINPGDIIYITDGVIETGGTAIKVSGSESAPIALIGYPGSDVKITGIYNNSSIINWYKKIGYWVFAKLKIETTSTGISTFTDMRVVGVEITGPEADGYGGAIGGADSNGDDGTSGGGKFFGLYIHDFGSNNTSEFHHTTYVSNRDGFPNKAYEYGWNYLKDNKAVHGFHIYDQSPGGDWTGIIKIHHNVVVNQKGPAVNLMSGGSAISVPLEIYNNIFINCGLGPDTTSFSPPKYAISLTEGIITSDVKIYNNLIYGYGYQGNAAALHQRFGGTVDLKNNIIIDTKNLTYVDFIPDNNSNNLYFSINNPSLETPAWAVNSVNSDPLFENEVIYDFRLKETSPAKNSGVNSVSEIVHNDFHGLPRPQAGNIDIGVFENLD